MKRRKYTSDEDALAGRKANQKAYREKRHAAGLCIDCAEPCVNRRTCEKCCRRSLVRKHEAGKVKGPYRLGSKLSPARPAYWLRLIRFTNPLLRKHWPDIESWLEKNYELYVEQPDHIIYAAVQLQMSGDAMRSGGSWGENDDWVIRSHYANAGYKSFLEDLVIAKIDLEREFQRCRQEKIVEGTDVISKAPSDATAMTARTTDLA